MAMVVKNNMTAINTLNTLNKNSSALSKSLQKVSSGMKINSAADDASGYAISERMRVQIRSLDQANQNTQNGSSMMKVAEGAVSSTVEILKTLKEKAVNAANDSNTDSDRQTIQKELDQSIDQINDNANVTFNGKYLVDGSKNTIGNATYTALSNQSLAKDTKATTSLTALEARNGDSLEIRDTDKVTVSYVKGGKTYSTTYQVKDTTLQDIFKAAEATNEDAIKAENGTNYVMKTEDRLFASADNASILAAQVKDRALTKDEAEGISTLISQTKTNKDDAKGELDIAIAGVATEKGKVAGAVTDWNAAAADWSALAGNGTLMGKTISSGDPANDGEYITNIGQSKNYQDISQKADTFLDDTITVLSKADTATGSIAKAIKDAAAVKGATMQDIADAACAAVTGTFDNEGIKQAFQDKVATATSATDFTNLLTKLKNTATDLQTAKAKLTADAKPIVDENGKAVAATAYETYLQKKSDMDDAQKAYDKYHGPKILDGKTVGLAASDDTVETASGENAITITANKAGIGGQISGLNISISDSQGNVKKSANAALDAFDETIRAQNKSEDNAISLQVGAKANQSIKVGLTDMRAEALGLQGADGTKLNISTQTKANAAINVLDNAIQKALDQQTTIGSVESRLEYTSSNLTTASENVQASESTIRDADMAKEMTNYTKNNVLLQAAQSMLAQANQSSSNVLSLLQ